VDVLKSVVVNWLLPAAAALAIYALVTAMRAPEVVVDEHGRAPVFTLAATEGAPVALESFRGRPVVVNFWATWCGPCKAEIPELNAFARAHPDVPVLGVAVDSGTLPTLARAKADLGIEFPVLRGNGGVQRQYGVRSVPTTFLVGPDGAILRTHVGALTAAQLERWLR